MKKLLFLLPIIIFIIYNNFLNIDNHLLQVLNLFFIYFIIGIPAGLKIGSDNSSLNTNLFFFSFVSIFFGIFISSV